MMGTTHRLVGGSTALVVSTAIGLPMPVDVAVAGVAAASSSIPDDLEKLLHLRHRRLTHYPLLQLAVISVLTAAVLEFVPAAPVGVVLAGAAAVALGCVVHSLADAMTVDPRGMALLWPFSRRGYHLLPHALRVRVDSKSASEWVFAALWTGIVLSYLYVRYRHNIST